jgi:beta-lactamase regulating signal transducer with metallopeptidase domain
VTLLSEFGGWWTATILPWAIDSTLAGLVLLGVARLVRKTSPALSRAIASIGLVKMVVPPFVLPVGLISFGVTDPAGRTLAPLGAPLAGWLIGVIGAIHLLGIAIGVGVLAQRVIALHRLRTGAEVITDPAALQQLKTLSPGIGLTRTPQIVESPAAGTPFVTGLFRPVIVLPAGLLEASRNSELRGLLAHELLHIRNYDLWHCWLRALALAIWWPSPLTRALARLQESATEEICDDLVLVRRLASAPDYARGLLKAAAHTSQPRRGPVAAAISTGNLESRMRRFTRPSSARVATSGLVALILLALLTMPPLSSGRASGAGWTRLVLFQHGQAPVTSHPAPQRHGHHHSP